MSTLLGTPVVHDPAPSFWSEQLGHRLQHVGVGHGADAVVHRADGSGVGWLRDGRLVAWLAVDRPREQAQARKRLGDVVEPARLADPALALRDA